MNAGANIVQNANITVTGSGTVDLRAGTSISMTDGVLTSSTSGNIRYVAIGTLSVGALSTTGSVSLSASSINDSGTTETDITANELRLVTTGISDGQGAGTSGNHLELSVSKLAANIAGTATGGLYVTEASAIQIGTLNAINANQVATDGTVSVDTQTTDAAQGNVASAGNLILVTTAGNIDTLAAGGAISAAGNLLIQAGGAGSITLDATVINTAGHTSVNAAGSITQNANITATSTGGTIELIAGNTLIMGTTATIGSNNSNILLNAATGDVTIETITAGTGSVAITAQAGSIIDRDTAGDAFVDISANGLILKASAATKGIGASGNNLEVSVSTLSLSAGAGGGFITEGSDVTIDTLTVAVNRVASNATLSTPALSTVTQEDLSITGAGNLVLVTGGALTVNGGTASPASAISTVSGNVLLSVTGSLDLNAALNAGSGSVSLISSGAMSLAAAGDISTTAGTVELESTGGTITMADGSVIQTGGGTTGNIRLQASGDITAGLLDARVSTDRSGSLTSQASWGAVSIISTGASILDNAEATVDVYAKELRLSASATAGGVGAGGNHLETEVGRVSALSGAGGLYLTEATAVTVGQTAAVAFNRVGVSGVAVAQAADAAQSNLGTTGNLVLVTTAGSIDTLSSGAVSAAGNVLMQAGGATSDITIGALLSSSAGSISVLAGRSVSLAAGFEIRAIGAGTVDVVAGTGNVTQAADSLIASAGGAIRVLAGSSITVGDISTGGSVSLTATSGSISDADVVTSVNDSQLNISAAGLRLYAGVGVGQSINQLETMVGAVSARATSGGIYLLESNGLTVGDVSVTVNRVKTDGGVAGSTVTDAAQSDLITTSGSGSIVLTSTTGSIVLTDGSAAAGIAGTAVSASGSGTVLIQTLDVAADVTVRADVVSGTGSISVLSVRSVTFDTGADIRTSAGGTVTVRGTNGDVTMPDSTIVTGSGAVVVTAGGTLQPGVIDTTGFVAIGTSPGGTVVFNRPIDRQGDNVTVIADRLDIQAGLMSVGSILLIAPLTPSSIATPPVEIVIGGADTGGMLHLSIDEVNLLQDGFTQITFGNGQVNQSIVLQGKTAANTPAPIVFKDPLILDIAGAGGRLSIEGQLQGDTFTVLGSVANTTTTLLGTDVSMAGNVTVNGLLKIDSASTITAGTAGTGNLLISGNVSGLTGVADTRETLSLGANGGNINVKGTISDIDALTITTAVNVTFDETVAVTGNLLINATGVVTFNRALTLTAGGTLTIRGASSVVFENGVSIQVDGNVTIDAQTLALKGGVNSLSTTGGVLTITSATTSSNVVLGANVSAPLVAGALNLSIREIEAIGTGFTRLVIGESGTGAVSLAGNSDFTSVVGTPMEIRGNTITVNASAVGGTVQVPASVSLLASGNITLNAGLSTVALNTITMDSSGGSISMAGATRIDSRGGDVSVTASGNLSLATINARSSDLTQGGIVNIRSNSGTISDSNLDNAADIFAKAINLYGYGPSTTSTGNVLEAVAEVVQILTPQGVVVRDSGVDGRAYFNVMHAGNLYQELVVVGSVTRVTEDPATLLQKDDAALIAAGIPRNSGLLRSPVSSLFLSSLTYANQTVPSFDANLTVSAYLSGTSANDALNSAVSLAGLNGVTGTSGGETNLLSNPSYGIADRLQQSYILGTPGEQPLISGLSTFSQDSFEYWVDTLSL